MASASPPAIAPSTSKKEPEVLTAGYMATLAALCTINKVTPEEIASIFTEEFIPALKSGSSRPRVGAAARLHTALASLRTPPRRRRLGRRLSLTGYDSEDESESKADDGDNVFERPCTWERDSACWLRDDLELWNNLLEMAGFEMREHVWSEMTIAGYVFSEKGPPFEEDILRVSLLIHFLLLRHRCVKRLLVDMEMSFVEPMMLWDAIKNGAGALTHLEYQPSEADRQAFATTEEATEWARAIFGLNMLTSLHICYAYFDKEVAELLTNFMDETTSLATLIMSGIEPTDPVSAGFFLESMALNRTLKSFQVSPAFLSIGDGEPLATLVRHHTALQKLEVHGGKTCSVSAVLKAAMESPSLKLLFIHACPITAGDIAALSVALKREPPKTPASSESSTTPTPTGRLEVLGFFNCISGDSRLEKLYASLIEGKLLSLTLERCSLGEDFAIAAAERLRSDSRLQILNVQDNRISIAGYTKLVNALEVNKNLQKLAFTVKVRPEESEMAEFCQAVRQHRASSRLHIAWINPRDGEFQRGVRLCKASTLISDLKGWPIEDARVLLDTVETSHTNFLAKLESAEPLCRGVTKKLVKVVGRTQFLSVLKLNISLSVEDEIKVLEALERNTSVEVLELYNFSFPIRVSRALGHMIKHNKHINMMTVFIRQTFEMWTEMRSVCREVERTIEHNHALTSFHVTCGRCNFANQFDILNTIRRNMMQVLEAICFVKGSDEKSHALAFDALKDNTHTVEKVLNSNFFNYSREEATANIEAARVRLAENYLALTGHARREVRGGQLRRWRPIIGTHLVGALSRACSFFRLNDALLVPGM